VNVSHMFDISFFEFLSTLSFSLRFWFVFDCNKITIEVLDSLKIVYTLCFHYVSFNFQIFII